MKILFKPILQWIITTLATAAVEKAAERLAKSADDRQDKAAAGTGASEA